MATEGLRQLLLDGVHAVQGAGAVGAKAAAAIEKHATHPALKAELKHGSEVAETWRQRLEAIERTAGGGSRSPADNGIIAAVHEAGETIARRAETDAARDLGIVATGQIALHYYIAAFGTLRAYAGALGLTDAAQRLQQCLDEAKAEDQRHTDLAAQILGA